jgi:NADH dehydrogenase [ubiquinone] 1 alpha subcomplex assembly factor 5
MPQHEQPLFPKNSIRFQQSAQKLWTSSTMMPQPEQRGGSAKSSALFAQLRRIAPMRPPVIGFLSPVVRHRTSARVADMFDMRLRAMRRDRAARTGPELFLYERVFGDCLERIALAQRNFERGLLIGCPDPSWPEALRTVAQSVDVRDPGRLFAGAAEGATLIEDVWEPPASTFDLVLAIGTLDTVNDLPAALRLIRSAMRSDGFFIGAFCGGNGLPQLRAAMRTADSLSGTASPHVHPRIEPAAVPPLLSQAGFVESVVDVDRIEVAYRSLARLIADLRKMGATNILADRSRKSLGRAAYSAAKRHFESAGRDGRTVEMFEVLHFACWTRE